MTRFGISALGRDPETDVVVIVSKTPSPAVADSILATLADTGMPSVVHFIGADAEVLSDQVEMTSTLADAAQAAVIKAGIDAPITGPITEPVSSNPGATGRVVGLYCGGTLCQETWSLLHKAGFEVRSNVAGEDALKVSAETPVEGHVVWDLGDDVFTRGRPHPMIEPSLRDDRVAAAGDDPSVGWVLVDCVIGYGAHDNPAESLAAASALALDTARQAGRSLQIIASVTGTELDPQNLNAQRHVLEAAGVHVAPSNAAAARWAMSQMGEVTP